MASVETFIVNFKKATGEITRLESELEAARVRRSELVNQLLTEHGKGPFEIDGVEMIISRTKVNTHFLTPKDKKNGGRPRVKKEIIDGQLVETVIVKAPPQTPALAEVLPADDIDPLEAALAEASR